MGGVEERTNVTCLASYGTKRMRPPPHLFSQPLLPALQKGVQSLLQGGQNLEGRGGSVMAHRSNHSCLLTSFPYPPRSRLW